MTKRLKHRISNFGTDIKSYFYSEEDSSLFTTEFKNFFRTLKITLFKFSFRE